MTFVRILRTTRVTLTHTFYVDGVATDATGTPTVSIKRLDGTEVATPIAGHPGTGQYTYVVGGSDETSNLDMLIGSITGIVAGNTIVQKDYIEVAEDFYFTIAQARALPPAIAASWTDAVLAETRIGTENELERITGQAFVPRFARVQLDGTGHRSLLLPRTPVRAIRSITLDGAAVTSYRWSRDGIIRSTGRDWPDELGNIIVEFEHGNDYPPTDLADAAMLRLRSRLGQTNREIPGRAASFTVQGGGVYRLSLPTREKTGIPDVDGVYDKYTAIESPV